MDIRITKTKRCIMDAFIALRSVKSLEKITVKELCEKAEINKSTFYTYYADIFDLSDHVGAHIVNMILESVSHSGDMLKNAREISRDMFAACSAQAELINIVFSGSQSGQLISKLYEGLRKMFFTSCPQYQDDLFMDIFLSYLIFGGYYAMRQYHGGSNEIAAEIISEITGKSSEIIFNAHSRFEAAKTVHVEGEA